MRGTQHIFVLIGTPFMEGLKKQGQKKKKSEYDMLKYRKLRREGTYPGALEHKSDSNHKISNLLFGSRKRK